MEVLNKEKTFLTKTGVVLMIILSLYFFAKTASEVKNYGNISSDSPATNVISFEGKGEVSATPDLATVSLTIRETAKDVKTAQSKVTAKESSVLEFLDKSDIEKKDIKTENYSSYPKYDYGVPCYGGIGIPCRQDAPKIIGYEVSEYVSVKIRDIENVGEVLQGIGSV
ncbi:MAG: SIMPL domain-containing protein, partial [Candidatus Berkelbacteria bacterium]|nr:SIMPL domain-containing protein [Candidatus Berkelbacteria bacterium]